MSVPDSVKLSLIEGLASSLVQAAGDKVLGPGLLTISLGSSGLTAGIKLATGQRVVAENFKLDDGAVSGRLWVDFQGATSGSPLSLTLFEVFTVSLEKFSVTLKDNSITESLISGTLVFPAFWNHDPLASTGEIKVTDLRTGAGGLSGTFALAAKTMGDPSPLISCNFGDKFALSLTGFSLSVSHGAITDSEIKGLLTIPGFKTDTQDPARIEIDLGLHQNGDFEVTAHVEGGVTIHCGQIFDVIVKEAFFDKRDDDFCLGVTGSIQFKAPPLSGLAPIEVEKLIIWSDGRFEIEGGTIPLPQNIRLPIGPVELSISAIHLGSYQRINSDGSIRKFQYFGFDGGVDVNPGGVDVRGKGIKFYFPEDRVLPDCYLEIQSIAIDLVIPGSASKETASLLISGYLSFGGTPADPEYEGGISFALPKMKIAGGASMKLRPKVPAFLIDAFVELSTPIPLGSTSLGIYGFRGLFGQRYVATKAAAGLQDTNTWFDYYKALPSQGVSPPKFEGPSQTKSYDGAFSIGAGVSLATVQGGGRTFSCKLFLLLSLPDLIYLEGKANILGPRVGLTGEDPPFSAVLALSRQSVEMAAGVNYKIPKDEHPGQILDLNAEMRAAFFFQNASAWYLNFGTMQNPTRARVLSLFDASSYLMLSAAGIAAGASITWNFNKSYAGGVVHASAGVYIKVAGFVSFQRPQIGASAMLGGHVDVSLFGFGFHLVIDTSLSVEVPKPFYIQGTVHLCVGVTIGFWKFKKTIEKCFDVEFNWEKDKTVDTSPILPFANLADHSVPSPIIGTNMLSLESFKVASFLSFPPSPGAAEFDAAVLPLDTWIDLEFLKGLMPLPAVDARIGRLSGQVPADTADKIPPVEVPHKVEHTYSIKALEIKAWNGNAWVDYRPYEAMAPPAALSTLNANPSAYKDGFWQNSGVGFSKLRLLAETSLSYMQQGQPGWYVPEQFGITSATLFCVTKLREKHCLDWIEIAAGTVYPAEAWRQSETVLFRVSGGLGNVIDWNSPFGIPRSLAIPNLATAQIVFDKPCVEVNLKLTTFSSGATVRFYKRETVEAAFVYTPVETRTLTQLQLLAEVQYNNPGEPVTKVEIDPIKGDSAAAYALQIEIDTLYRQLYETKLTRKQKEVLAGKIKSLEQELTGLKEKECVPKGFDPEALAEGIRGLDGQVAECRKQLGVLPMEQMKACSEAAELGALLTKNFTETPSILSYEIVSAPTAVPPVFRFLIYDDLNDSVLFNGAAQFPDMVKAQNALIETLDLALNPKAYAPVTGKAQQYSFQIVDGSGSPRAASPAVFGTEKERDAFVVQTRARIVAAHATGKFTLAWRQDGRLPCAEFLDHWERLPKLGAVGDGKCKPIADEILSARNAFCREYNKLYRQLYACDKQLLDEAAQRCEELTRELETGRMKCKALSDQLTALLELQKLIDKSGPLNPPKGTPCVTLIHEVCCLSLEDYQFNHSAPGNAAIEEDYGNAVHAIEKMLTPIWRPGTKYYVRLQVNDRVNNGVADQDSEFYFGFRTAGPLGHFHTDPSANYVAANKPPEQYMLTGLKGYIDYGRSYPNADGELVRAKPLFYEDARILLFFTKRYVYHLFGDWPAYHGLPALTGNAMQIIVKDPAENTSIPNPPPPGVTTTEIPQAVTSWPTDDDPRIPEDVRALLTLRNPELLNPDFVGGHCWSSGGEMVKPASVYTSVEPKYLKPLKLYTAIVNNVYGGQTKEVHRYVFQTSRYPEFLAQVKSYRLDDGKGNQRDAVFRIEVPLTSADLNLMYDVVTGSMSASNAALAGTWADPFDRLVEGVMKLKPLDAATGTEFNMVRNSTTDAVVAVWICNPEPFNDPKLPADVLERSLRVMSGLNPDLSYKVLFSKDCAQAFVMHPSKLISLMQMQFRFAYIEWNGSDYVDHATVISDVIQTNI